MQFDDTSCSTTAVMIHLKNVARPLPPGIMCASLRKRTDTEGGGRAGEVEILPRIASSATPKGSNAHTIYITAAQGAHQKSRPMPPPIGNVDATECIQTTTGVSSKEIVAVKGGGGLTQSKTKQTTWLMCAMTRAQSTGEFMFTT